MVVRSIRTWGGPQRRRSTVGVSPTAMLTCKLIKKGENAYGTIIKRIWKFLTFNPEHKCTQTDFVLRIKCKKERRTAALLLGLIE